MQKIVSFPINIAAYSVESTILAEFEIPEIQAYLKDGYRIISFQQTNTDIAFVITILFEK